MAPWRFICLQTLRARFLLALALIGIVPLGLVGLGMATLDRRALAEQSAQELTGLARGLAGELEVYVDDLLSTTRAMAALPEIVSLDPARQEPLLKELFHHYPQLARLSTFDLSGTRIASSHPGGAPSIAVRQSFQTAAQRGHQAWEVAAALSSGHASLLIHTPIRDAERRVVGVVGAVIDLVNLSAVVGRVSVGGGGRVLVLDANERVLMDPAWAAAQEHHDYSWMTVRTGGHPASPATVRYQLGDEAFVAGYAPVPSVDWTVVVARPEQVILAPAQRSWRLALIGLGTSAGLALLMSVGLARTLTRPVHALATAAEALTADEATGPLPVMASNVSELRILMEAFTEMREAVIGREAALRQSEERFRSLIEHSADAITLLDSEGTICYTTPQSTRILGYTADEILGRKNTDRMHPDDLPAMQDVFRRLLAQPGASITAEMRLRHKDGSWRWIEAIRTNLLADPRVQAIVVNHRDITDRKRAEEQLQRLLHEKEALLREIHHRVKNNLTVISSLLDLQSDTIQSPEVHALLKDSQQRIRSMALIHEQLYRADDLVWIDFAAYVRDLGAHITYAYGIDTKRISLAMSCEEVRLNLDTAIPCGLIVQELLSNCFKHAFPGDRTGDIHLTLHTALGDGVGRGPQALGATGSAQGRQALSRETYILSISDTGVGFPAGLDFRQTTSLGLQLVCLLTEQLGGTITLDQHHGTTFTITFTPVTRNVQS